LVGQGVWAEYEEDVTIADAICQESPRAATHPSREGCTPVSLEAPTGSDLLPDESGMWDSTLSLDRPRPIPPQGEHVTPASVMCSGRGARAEGRSHAHTEWSRDERQVVLLGPWLRVLGTREHRHPARSPERVRASQLKAVGKLASKSLACHAATA